LDVVAFEPFQGMVAEIRRPLERRGFRYPEERRLASRHGRSHIGELRDVKVLETIIPLELEYLRSFRLPVA
jgi:hypothetical protein